jgi:aspartyl-tRNA(Asn)/glutamyl-tRNA(Gln) amidotransferase subunit B
MSDKRFLQLLRQTIVELGISDAEMEKGTLRADANVSVRKRGENRLPNAHRAEEHELVQLHRPRDGGRDRAADRRLGVGAKVVQQTFDFDAATGKLTPRRRRRRPEDYRYFPEPDLVPVEPGDELVERRARSCRSCRARGSARLEPELDFELAEGLVTSGARRLYARPPARPRARSRTS